MYLESISILATDNNVPDKRVLGALLKYMADELDTEGNLKVTTPQKLEAITNLYDLLSRLRPNVTKAYEEHLFLNGGQIVLEEPN